MPCSQSCSLACPLFLCIASTYLTTSGCLSVILDRYGNSCSVWGPRRDWGERKGRAGQGWAGQGKEDGGDGAGEAEREREKEIEEEAGSVTRRTGGQIGGVRGKRRGGSERRGAKQNGKACYCSWAGRAQPPFATLPPEPPPSPPLLDGRLKTTQADTMKDSKRGVQTQGSDAGLGRGSRACESSSVEQQPGRVPAPPSPPGHRHHRRC